MWDAEGIVGVSSGWRLELQAKETHLCLWILS